MLPKQLQIAEIAHFNGIIYFQGSPQEFVV